MFIDMSNIVIYITTACFVLSTSSCIPVDSPKQQVTTDTVKTKVDSSAVMAFMDTHAANSVSIDSTPQRAPFSVNTKNADPDELTVFAESLIGIPYKYASTDPNVGFDCSGFITYVFSHFNIQVPRSSVDFTNVGKTIPVTEAKRGDIILFTGTDTAERVVGHMGIIVSNTNGKVSFIHSSSGKANGVTVTPLENYYKTRYVKTIRVFKQNNS